MSITNSLPRDTRAVGREVTAVRAALEPGSILQSRYRIVRQLGKGGMGAVYEAVDQRLDATVALKETFSIDERLRRQFELEARLLAQLNHPALPRVSDYFTEDERAFLVMQFITGVDLAEIIAKQPGPFPRNQVVAWADQLLDALVFLHTRERQIIHRDIKPHNLKLTSNGTIALLDFGLAKAQAPDPSTTDVSICGYTRRYAPLEQIQDQGTTPRSDIYALGATLYHLLTGIKPADAVIREAALVNSMADPLRPANEVHPAVGQELAEILSHAMAQNPADRFATAHEFREALAQLGRNRDQLNKEATLVEVHKTVTRAERARNADAFESYSILKPEEPVMFAPTTSSRSNAVVAGILLVVLTALIGSIYGYHRWSEVFSSNQMKPTRAQQSAVSATPNKLRLNPATMAASSAVVVTEKSEASPFNSGAVDGRVKDHGSFRFENSTSNPKPAPTQRATKLKVNIPTTRLPGANLRQDDPPSVMHLPAFGQREAVSERQVLRTPDGTQIVKFSDGTTKVFRPGEKASSSNATPQ
ncbi:MAG TPA: serine/threonine-protein kinase [Pyrinomonadaceae bacterium]|nr:serine/threonine-protein kinase [Pyrinomonadaceae bacterium]